MCRHLSDCKDEKINKKYSPGLTVTTSLHVLLQCWRTFSSLHDQITIALPSFFPADTGVDLSTVRVSPVLAPLGPEEADFQVGGFKSGLKPSSESPGSEA